MKVIAGVFGKALPVVGKIFITGAIPDKTAESFRVASRYVTMGSLLGIGRGDRVQWICWSLWVTGTHTRHKATHNNPYCQIFHFPPIFKCPSLK
jgi:hypothetical protein